MIPRLPMLCRHGVALFVAAAMLAALPARAYDPGDAAAPATAAPQEAPAIDEALALDEALVEPVTGNAVPRPGAVVMTPPEWDRETLRLFGTLPVQDGGRVKPLDTIAQFTLLRLNGQRTYSHPGEGANWMGRRASAFRLSATEWLLNCLLFPEVAVHYQHFLVDDSQVMDIIGVPHENKGKRDRYSYAELIGGRQALFQHAMEYIQKEERDRSRIENMIVHLASNVRDFELIRHYFDFARMELDTAGSKGLDIIFEGKQPVRFSDVLGKAAQLQFLFQQLEEGAENMPAAVREAERAAVVGLMQQVNALGERAQLLAMFPAFGAFAEQAEYFTAGEFIEPAFRSQVPIDDKLQVLAAVERMVDKRHDPAAFTQQLRLVHTELASNAEARGEYAMIPLEWTLYRLQPFAWAQWLYVLCFLLVAFLWLAPRNRWLYVGTSFLMAVPTLWLITGITMRCIIRSRPPVTTLYETILFITACVVVTALFIEWANRRRVALSVGAFLGAFGMFLANRYEAMEGVDTMPQLIAVLDTNFWLTTHVLTVTLGYAAGLFACALGCVYLICKALGMVGMQNFDKKFLANLTRMTYGVIAFGLVFATVGTILGGLWANDSWGRFWGWDPKENGALMIVLWMVIMLHARMGGYLKQHGFNVAAIGLGAVVCFSWWHTNLLGVGLHSYGFTSGVLGTLIMFYAFVAAMMVIGVGLWFLERARFGVTQSPAVLDDGTDDDAGSDGPPAPKPKRGKGRKDKPVIGSPRPAKADTRDTGA